MESTVRPASESPGFDQLPSADMILGARRFMSAVHELEQAQRTAEHMWTWTEGRRRRMALQRLENAQHSYRAACQHMRTVLDCFTHGEPGGSTKKDLE